jgi:hypothetical protein
VAWASALSPDDERLVFESRFVSISKARKISEARHCHPRGVLWSGNGCSACAVPERAVKARSVALRQTPGRPPESRSASGFDGTRRYRAEAEVTPAIGSTSCLRDYRCRRLGVRPLPSERGWLGFRLTLARLLKCRVPTNPRARRDLANRNSQIEPRGAPGREESW